MKQVIIFVVVFLAVRFILRFFAIVIRAFGEARDQMPIVLDEEALKADLATKTEKELWQMRDDFFEDMITAAEEGKEACRRFCLDAIAIIDEKIFAMKRLNNKGPS